MSIVEASVPALFSTQIGPSVLVTKVHLFVLHCRVHITLLDLN